MTDPGAERLVAEPAKDPGTGRTPYQRDRARVLHSAAFRRLAAKTQVITASGDDFLRTRLTHSLEVAQIAREMGVALGADPDVVDTAGLAHDLGHPPFGHNGEDALDVVAQPAGGFEGNAQTLRVVSRLEAKVPGAGLNLTRATLDAITKYPWGRKPGTRKFNVYPDDQPVFEWYREQAPPDRRCLEAQIMDWADDVAYSVHDLEDGVHAGHVRIELLADPDERDALCADVARVYSPESPGDLRAVLTELLAEPVVEGLARYDGSHLAQSRLKQVTSALVGRLSAVAVRATREKTGPGPLRGYAADLEIPRRARAECALLKGLALRYVMNRPGANARYVRQREILTRLVEALLHRAPDALDPIFAPLWKSAADDAARLRVVIDQVASLTDPAAVAWHDRLAGPLEGAPQ
ncbi:deoxyguanosinetriphosphate triphosphohydrolase [Cryptosporangium arvum]|uniref:Deoxyguanosinetriphosphate triphosphohydrolase-like protein n=1 Tax=Cryptosporangium arvum DSM 44712 TaxID=927661 RepID=A0A010ZP56_9ACTN|nr:deoxyguanosinetriphosphate triphosphohydrolase [Cryptosporangium arvum]EXG80469.1 putative deoxyguanosinetriphosphate triphosphohydrolase [Cryptosporangium arvum DSM 44712]